MKYLLALVAIFITLGSSSADDIPALPPQPAGESLSSFLEKLFPSDTTGNSSTDTKVTGAKNKRGTTLVTPVTTGFYTESYGLHQSVWDEDTDSGTVTYNLSVDFSSCGTGIKLGTNVGIYTFSNGTTNNDTDFRDMVADLWSLRHSRQSLNPNYANHTAVEARLALDEANQLLNNGLICRNDSNTALAPPLDRNELRHLLANKHSYWTAVILSAVAGASIGATVATLADLTFRGNISAENVVQTAIVIGAVVLIGGILTRCDQVGRLDRAEDLANRARDIVPQGREAVVQNVYIAWARRQLARIVRRQVEEALSEAGVASASTPNSRQSGLGSPGSPGSPASACLSELEAGEAAGAIELMSDVNLNLEPIKETIEQLGPRDEQVDYTRSFNTSCAHLNIISFASSTTSRTGSINLGLPGRKNPAAYPNLSQKRCRQSDPALLRPHPALASTLQLQNHRPRLSRKPNLFHLPLEIRRLIYTHSLTSSVTHTVSLGSRLGRVHFRDLHCARPWFHRCWAITVKGSDLYHGEHDDFLNDEEEERDKRGLLPLVMACRQIYVEAIPVLYERTTFSMVHVESVISLADTILPQRLNTIRSMELGLYFHSDYHVQCRVYRSVERPLWDIATWETLWSILASMKGLISLRVDLVGPSFRPLTPDEERILLGPASKVTRPRVWDMRLECKSAGLDWGAQGAPFRLTSGGSSGNESNATEMSM